MGNWRDHGGYRSYDNRRNRMPNVLVVVLIIIIILLGLYIFRDKLGLKLYNPCPQINVSMEEYNYFGSSRNGIKEQTHDGWSIVSGGSFGDYINCGKGDQEGENPNYYYCGGFTSTIIGPKINGYIQKTEMNPDGTIGKTYKYVLWNTYDENKSFVSTKCLGDPDKINERRAKDFMDFLTD